MLRGPTCNTENTPSFPDHALTRLQASDTLLSLPGMSYRI